MENGKLRIGFDTGFFVKLLKKDERAVGIYRKLLEGEIIGVVSVIVIFELKRLALKGVVKKEAYDILERNWPTFFQIEDVDKELALEAASVSHGTGLPMADALIYTVCKRAGCREIYTLDSDFERVSGELKVIFLEKN